MAYELSASEAADLGDVLAGVAGRWAAKRVLPAEDIEQTAWVGALEAARSYDPGKGVPFLLWALKQATWAVIHAHEDEYRQRGERRQMREAEAPAGTPADEQMDLADAYARLPADLREVLHERFWLARTQVETARSRGLRQRQVSDREREALERLRVYLSPPGEKRVGEPPRRKWGKKK